MRQTASPGPKYPASGDPDGIAPADVLALAHHRRVVPATLEEVVRDLAVAASAAIVLRRAAVEQVRRPDERLSLPDRPVLRLEPELIDALGDVGLVIAVLVPF